MLTSHWTVRRARYRHAMANAMANAARKAGAHDVTRWKGARSIVVTVHAPGGACLSVELHGDSPIPHTLLGSWYMPTDAPRGRTFAPAFHHGFTNVWKTKATRVCLSVPDLLDVITRDVSACLDGSAYVTA